mmetsp:Transcript_9683/g.18518  ORF Transcript_9683/g.18518 Transcript_9683/m.18518 type:complete len:86 (-) Transcript_9683:163-420(-)
MGGLFIQKTKVSFSVEHNSYTERDGTKVCSSNPLEEQRSIDVYYPEQADVDDNLPFLTRTIPTTLKRRHFYIFMAVLFRVSCRLG